MPADLIRAVLKLPWPLVITRGPDHVVEFLSPAACELAGARQVQGRPVADAMPEALTGGVVELLDRAFTTGHPFHDVEQRVVDRRGDATVERWFDLGCQPVREPDGVISGLVLYGMEITEKVRARRRVEFLAQASAVLLESAGAADVLERAAALVVPAHGEVVLVDLTQQDGILVPAMAVHGDPALAEALRSSPPAPTRIAQRVLETGRTEAVPGGSGLGDVPAGLKLRCLLVVPMVARGQILGTFSVGTTTRPGFADDEVTLIEGLAARAALVVHTAQLHEAQRTAREAAEQAQARNAALHQLAAALSQAPTVAEIGRLTVVDAATLIGADAATLFVREGDELERVQSAGWVADAGAGYHRLTLQRGRPLSDAVLSGEPIWLESAAQWRRRYPEMASVHAAGGYEAAASLPLVADGRVIGGLLFSFLQPRAFTPDDRHYLSAVAVLCAQALDRARLYLVEQQARVAAERQRDRSAFLAKASLVLDAPVSTEQRLQRLADLATPVLADWCVVHLIRGSAVDEIAVAHSDPAKREFVREIQRRYPPDPRGTSGPIQVARTGRVVFVPELTDDMLRESTNDLEHLELLRQVGMRSAMIVPLAVPGRVLGALTLITADSGRVLDDSDLAFAQDLAQRAALALENARLYEQQRQIAHTLQTALLPDDLPVIPGLTMAARFVPHGDGIEVGGDLYDVFPSPDGWAIAVGDVCGKGPAAAGLTALVRYTLRAEVLHGRGPADALHQVNEAMLRHRTRAMATFCSLVHGSLTLVPQGIRVRLASAGHLPPLVLHADGTVQTLPAGGTVLGIYPDPDLPETEFLLAAGDTLLLYTDGVTEARGPDSDYGLDRVTDLLHSCTGETADDIAEQLTRNVLTFQAGHPRDDIALLVLQATPPSPPMPTGSASIGSSAPTSVPRSSDAPIRSVGPSPLRPRPTGESIFRRVCHQENVVTEVR